MPINTSTETTEKVTPADVGCLFDTMRNNLRPQGSAPLVRLFLKENAFYDASFVQKAVDVAQARCTLAASGIDELNPLEMLALQLLCDSAHIKQAK